MKIAIFYSRLFKKSHKNVSIVKVFKKFLHENYPKASKHVSEILIFYLKNGSFLKFYIKNSKLKKIYIKNDIF